MKGRYGIHGGQYIPETLMSEIHKIEEAYEFYKNDQAFNDELNTLLKELYPYFRYLKEYDKTSFPDVMYLDELFEKTLIKKYN